MIEYTKYDLFPHNTMRLHCIADFVIFPESNDELIRIISNDITQYKILSGGSNVILPSTLCIPVIILTKIKSSISISGDFVECNASTRIQELIRFCQKMQLGGMEYLYSVPCTLGGAVYMNAGRGEIFNQSISDFVEWVECYNIITRKIERLSKFDCKFSYRNSIFHTKERIILKVGLHLKKMSKEEIEEDILLRMKHSKDFLDASKPSAGSIFIYANHKILKLVKGLRIGGAKWSSKTENWISNYNNAKSRDIRLLIKVVQFLHKLTGYKCKREVELW